jgi:hypothetical protein
LYSRLALSPGVPDLTKGLLKLSTGDYAFTTLIYPTRNQQNAAAYIPPVIISAIGYLV